MTRIFILNGHPAAGSLSAALATTYARAAEAAGHPVRLMQLSDMVFDADFGFAGYARTKPLEPDLERMLTNLEWCQHLLLVTPLWWGGLPGRLKGMIDRALLPGRAFDTRKAHFGMPRPMLSGRSARVVLTSDTPGWFLRLFYHNALLWQLKGQVLGFVGIKPTRITHLSPASQPKPGAIAHWLAEMERLGSKAM